MIGIYNKLKIFYYTKKALQTLDNQISFISNNLKCATNQNDDFESLMRLNLFCHMYQKDFIISRKTVLMSNQHEMDYHLRNLSLLCFEYIENIQTVLSEYLRPAINKYELDKDVISAYHATNKALSKIRHVNSKYLKEIRDNCTAHRNPDSILQLGIIDKLDKERIFNISMEISEFQKMLFNMWEITINKKLQYNSDQAYIT